jgi:hypothetical protein
MGPKKDTTGTFDIGTHDHDSQNRGHEDNVGAFEAFNKF